MSYNKIISYSDIVEIYEYTGTPTGKKPQTRPQVESGSEDISVRGEDIEQSEELKKVRTEANARSAVLAFRRLVASNLGVGDEPVLFSLTYAENMQDFQQGREDFHAFARAIQYRFGNQVRYICVPEFQKRGAIHYHALFWGLPLDLAREERHTRFFASLWGHGFADLIVTDGSHKLSSYLSKYMAKSFMDERLFSKKAYIASRNVERPKEIKNDILVKYYTGDCQPDLSTGQVLTKKTYPTQWLGEGRYTKIKIKID